MATKKPAAAKKAKKPTSNANWDVVTGKKAIKAKIAEVTAPIEKQSKSIKGGKRVGAGRKAGVRNKKTAAVLEAVEQSGVTPLDFMLSIMRNPLAEGAQRLDAAKSAAPYVHAKLSNVELNAKVTTHEASLDDLE